MQSRPVTMPQGGVLRVDDEEPVYSPAARRAFGLSTEVAARGGAGRAWRRSSNIDLLNVASEIAA